MSEASWAVLDEYSFDGKTVEYRHPRFYQLRSYAEKDADRISREQMGKAGFVRCVIRPSDKVAATLDECRDLQDELARTKHLQEVTADHLRKARTDLHNARHDVRHAERLLSRWSGNETGFERQRTPGHYRGDGLVTCSRAMHSAMSQEPCRKAELMPVMAVYWWGCAFKYLWRMWSKADPESDADKARDCIGRAVRAWRECRDED